MRINLNFNESLLLESLVRSCIEENGATYQFRFDEEGALDVDLDELLEKVRIDDRI